MNKWGFKKTKTAYPGEQAISLARKKGAQSHYMVFLDDFLPIYGVFLLTFISAVFYLLQASIERSIDLQQRRKGL